MKQNGIIRWTTGCHVQGIKEKIYTIPTFTPGKEVVDKSMFQPISETIKRLNGSRELTGDEVKVFYDFSSGQDNHGEIPFNRTSENLDMAILSNHIVESQGKIKEKIAEGQKEVKREEARQARIAQNKVETSTSAE